MSLPRFDSLGRSAAAYGRDLAERVVTTFLQAFIGALVLTSPFDLDMWQSAAMGGVAAALALVKGVIARVVGDQNSASLSRRV